MSESPFVPSLSKLLRCIALLESGRVSGAASRDSREGVNCKVSRETVRAIASETPTDLAGLLAEQGCVMNERESISLINSPGDSVTTGILFSVNTGGDTSSTGDAARAGRKDKAVTAGAVDGRASREKQGSVTVESLESAGRAISGDENRWGVRLAVGGLTCGEEEAGLTDGVFDVRATSGVMGAGKSLSSDCLSELRKLSASLRARSTEERQTEDE